MPGCPASSRISIALCAVLSALALLSPRAAAQEYSRSRPAPATLPGAAVESVADDRILISADYAQEWRDGGDELYLLRGNCVVRQGEASVRGGQLLVRRTPRGDASGASETLSFYFEDGVRFDRNGRTFTDSQLFLQLSSAQAPQFDLARRTPDSDGSHDEFYVRAETRRRKKDAARDVVPAQFTLPLPEEPGPELKFVQLQPQEGALRRIRIFRRSADEFGFKTEMSTNTTPPEQITYITGGVNVLIDGFVSGNRSLDSLGLTGTIDLSADNVIIWTDAAGSEEVKSEMFQSPESQMQIYLEGNIEIRQGGHVIRAERAFYDARSQQALIINAELRAYVSQYDTNIRLRAESIRQLSPNSFHARNAWTTTSQYGKPGYRLQATDVYLENRIVDPWLSPETLRINPETGMPQPQETFWMRSINNTFVLEDVPLLYTPIISGPSEDPQWPIRNLTVSQDRVFGTQLRSTWDAAQIFGLHETEGIEWDLRADYYTDRGPLLGSDFTYQGWGLFGRDGVSRGTMYFDLMYDDGLDNLGAGRRALAPAEEIRGRATMRHRQPLPFEMLLIGELGYLSDRNYLEQYYEREFDQGKDQETLLYLKQDADHWGWSLLARPELNDFEASTMWLPKADLYGLSQPIFNTPFTWSSHSSVGYANIQQGDPPFDPTDLYNPIPYAPEVDGIVAMTRQQVDLPFSLGPLDLVPFAMGEAAFWGEDMTGSSMDRLVGQAGVRAHASMWKLYPYVQSDVFNLTGLMHKIDFHAEYSFTDATQNFTGVPQYNEFEENSQERFRRRLLTNTFGGALPLIPGYPISPLDPRYYLIRSGAGSTVTAPYHELVDDLQVLRFSMRHRLQTKVGPPEAMRIQDWMIFEAGASFFPNSTDDHFGEDFGLVFANYEWNLSPRTRILAGGVVDPFDFGQETWNVGLLTQRSQRGSFYVGYRRIHAGPDLDSQILSASYSYVMSPKWISTVGTAFDLGENQNRGQSLTVTRVGEYALIHFGAGFDASKGNANFTLSVEPRFGRDPQSAMQLGTLFGNR